MASGTISAREQRESHAKRRLYFIIAFCVLLLDQFTKFLVDRSLSLHDTIAIIPGIFNLTHVENQGAAFGLFADSPAEWRAGTLILFSAIALVVVSVLLWRNSHSFTTGGMALALILGGAIGNLADRIFQGHVVDFLDFYVSTHHWPAFNVADSAIVVGALLLVSEILFAGAPQETPSAIHSS